MAVIERSFLLSSIMGKRTKSPRTKSPFPLMAQIGYIGLMQFVRHPGWFCPGLILSPGGGDYIRNVDELCNANEKEILKLHEGQPGSATYHVSHRGHTCCIQFMIRFTVASMLVQSVVY